MIERTALEWRDFGKARFFDVQLPKPDKNRFQLVLTDELLAEWDAQATEIVDCEPINDSIGIGGIICGTCEQPLSILRVTHADGHVTIEPVYKLFPAGKNKHGYFRNSLLIYVDIEKEISERMKLDSICEKFGRPKVEAFSSNILQMMYARKYDITCYQARSRTHGASATWWNEELGGKFDQDLCWFWHM